MKSTTWSAFETAWKWGSFVAAHAMVAVLLIGVITLFQWLLLSLGDPKLLYRFGIFLMVWTWLYSWLFLCLELAKQRKCSGVGDE
jgi:hypothetical protein